MEILKKIYYVTDYTLQFAMWLVIGRVAAQVFIRNPNNVIQNMFMRFTEPLYLFVKRFFPFTRVPDAKRPSVWGQLDGLVPIVLILGIYIILRPLIRIIIGVIIVNFQ